MAGKKVVWREFGDEPALERPEENLPPQQQDLRIQVSRKGRGGKTVTLITGFRHDEATLAKLCKQLKAKCGTGGTAKEQVIEIQGDHRQVLLETLKAQGYRAKLSGG